MRIKISLHFYVKSIKSNTDDKLPIYLRLTINGEQMEFSSKKFINKSKWLSKLATMTGLTKEVCSINSYLNIIRSKILSAEMDLIHKDE